MTSVGGQSALSGPRSPGTVDAADGFRRMVLLLETADLLERRARRTADPAQVDVLMRRARQRRDEADALRASLAAHGAALTPRQAASLSAPTVPGSPRP